jgi:hypothetical protein
MNSIFELSLWKPIFDQHTVVEKHLTMCCGASSWCFGQVR